MSLPDEIVRAAVLADQSLPAVLRRLPATVLLSASSLPHRSCPPTWIPQSIVTRLDASRLSLSHYNRIAAETLAQCSILCLLSRLLFCLPSRLLSCVEAYLMIIKDAQRSRKIDRIAGNRQQNRRRAPYIK